MSRQIRLVIYISDDDVIDDDFASKVEVAVQGHDENVQRGGHGKTFDVTMQRLDTGVYTVGVDADNGNLSTQLRWQADAGYTLWPQTNQHTVTVRTAQGVNDTVIITLKKEEEEEEEEEE